MTGEEYPGYDATGFTITSTDGANSNDYTFTSNEYSLTIDLTFIKTYIEDSYWHKQNTSDTPIQINVIKTGATYKLYIEENEENYYSVAWDSSIEGDTDLGGSDANGVYINVAYAGGFDNLKTAIENGALKLTRNYFNLTSFKYNGSTVMSYSDAWTLAGLTYQNEATLITPIWTMGDLDGFISNTLFTNGADNSIEYRLGTYQEIMSASLSSGETIALNSELLNGLKITGFGYSLNGDSDLLTGNIKFNTCNLSTSGENTIFFYVEVKDLIETSQTKTASSASITITAVKNEFVFEFANNAVSAKYNGSSSLGKLTWNSTIKFAIKYDWKGDEITQDWSENGTWYDLEKFSTEYSRPGSAEAYDAFWDAGEDKDITFKLLGKGGSSGIKYAGGDTNIGEINYQNIFDGLEFTLAGALEVTKLDINLNFNIKFANDGAATSYTSETQSGSVSGLDDAEYSFTLIFDESIIGEYNAVENISKIKICNLKVNILSSEKEIIKTFEMTDENGESLDSNVNFTYSISEASILEIGAFSTIFLEIKEAISYTYNGLKPTSGVVSYSDGKYILTITNKDTLLAQVEVWSGYKIAGENAEFSDEERGSYIDAISFDFSSFKADVGSYTLEVNDFTLGSDEIKVNMSGLTTVDILKKEITISNISKVFDGTAVFDSSKEGHSITVDGLIDGESLVFTGTFQDIYGNDGIRVGSWDNTVISFESGNYKFSGEAESGTLYSDNEVLAVGTVIPATGTITSLDAQTFDYGLNASSWDWAEGLWNNAGGGEKSIKGFNVEEYVENIKLEESNISTSTGGYYSAGDDFTVVFIVTIPEFQYEKDGKFTNEHVISCNVVINKKAITVTNTSQAITKKYDGTNTLTVGLGQAINAEGGYFTADVLAGDIVTVISGAYSDSSVGEHSIELDFGGADHGNYIINHSVIGTITENAFTIYLYDEYNAEVGNVVVEYDPDTFDEAGALEVMGKLEALIPAKDGYELDYIVSFDGGTIITQENLKEFIDSAISDSSDSLNFKFYYKIVTFALTLKFDESFKITNHNTDEIISNGDGSIAEATFELTIDESLSLVIDYQAGYYVNITDDGQFSGDYSHNSAGYIISISGLYADEILTLEKVLDTYIIYLAVHDDFAGVAEIPTEVREQRVQIGDSINLAQTILDDDYFLLEWNIYDGNYSKIADAGDTTILFDESFALMMEYQAFGAPQEYYTFYAVYTDAMVSIEIEVVGGANGVIVGQGDLDDVKVLNDSKKAVVLDKYDESNVLATISYREDITGGYHLESITFYDEDGEEIDKTNIGFKDEESVV